MTTGLETPRDSLSLDQNPHDAILGGAKVKQNKDRQD